ncbi:hypothetical protein KH389_24700 [Pseudomonas qingdaonensis]|uniref:Uncharacterized protein n=1 Tax=Pseudomonas qingdaonensis TaxID=2056231 RepID=A0ABX8DQE9_9PSED|nr:hypothetical protein [Pseudomonas qingdaonensis]QVL18532.1 hypothetical protein KH389_24700 [Pseudomonas qingdaonensis]
MAKASILSVNCALEAAANSFLQPIEINDKFSKELDKLKTLDKFDFLLQWHTNKELPRGDAHIQAVVKMIVNRNNMVHPKVNSRKAIIETKVGPEGITHTEIKPPPRKGKDTKHKLLAGDFELYTHEDAKAALIAIATFLNAFVEYWGVGYEEAEKFSFQAWDGSINARPVMFRTNQIATLIKNDHFLNIQFMGIHGMFKST